MQPFVHLHAHTEYSLLDGANRIPDMVKAAVEDGHDAVAITDHGNLFGAIEFYKECKKAGVKPLLGCEVYIARQSRLNKHNKRENPYSHLTLLARDATGWRNLMELASIAYLEGHHFRPRIDMEVLHRYAKGITCLSGCMSGPVNQHLRVDDEASAIRTAGELRELFGPENFYLEVMRNGIKEQDRLTEGMVRMMQKVDSPIVATNDIHYLRHEDCNAQDALICMHTGSKRDDPDRWRMDTDTLFFRTREEMNRIFSDLPEALANTQRVAEAIDVEIELGTFRLPNFVPEDGSTPEAAFRKLCEEGFAQLYPGNPTAARERLEQEIKVITEMGFISYFLIVWDLIRHAREQDIPVGPGRGSAAGSIVAYCMSITRIDPMKYDLLFERFLNSSRISMPDIDIDFCKDRREEMIRYVRQRYGDENVCQIITFGKMKARAALRDMARVLDIPLGEVDKVAKKIPEGPGASLQKALKEDPEMAEVGTRSKLHGEWLDLAVRVEGLARHSSVHAAGVVIADRPLRELVPLCKQDETILTQWEMHALEDVGLLKMDFLGLRTLTILADTCKFVKERHGVEIDLEALPLDDGPTYELLRKADTEGVFQLESGGMRRLLNDLKPDCFEDVVAVLALFRPGPLGSGLVTSFVNRKHGNEPISYQHELMEDILDETYGVLVYQEQIMRVAQKLGGFSLNEADTLRKAMGKKKKSLMEPFEQPFLDGSNERGVPAEVAREIWDMMVMFAEYGFNKSHSTGYALVTYQAAWCKAHYPAEFYASTLTHEAHDSDKLRTLLEDAKRHAIRVLPPCVNHSLPTFTVASDDAIRYGLAAIKGVGQGAAEALVRIRADQPGGAFPEKDELFVTGVTECVNKTTFESLVKAGALDAFHTARVDLLDDLEDDLKHAARLADDRKKGQGLLFGGPNPEAALDGSGELAREVAAHHAPRKLTDAERRRTLQCEKEALGLYLTRHPLDPYRDLLDGIAAWNSKNLADAPDQGIIALAGIATGVKVLGTRKDPSKKYARLRIEDLYGSTSALIWPRTLENYREMIQEDFIGLFKGKLETSGEEPVLMIESVEALADPKTVQLTGSLEIHLSDLEVPFEKIQEVLRHHRGESPVRFYYTGEDGKPVCHRAGPEWSVKLDGVLFAELEKLLGTGRVKAASKKKPVEIAAPGYRR